MVTSHLKQVSRLESYRTGRGTDETFIFHLKFDELCFYSKDYGHTHYLNDENSKCYLNNII